MLPLLAIAAASATVAQAQTDLVREGRPVAVIVDGGTPEGCLSAASELRSYVRKITGSELEIVPSPRPNGPNVFVGGDTAFARLGQTPEQLNLGRDGFVIRTVGGDLVLAGARNISTLFAVYDLLEDDFGCHWFWPGQTGEVVPARATLTVGPLDRVERPSFALRWIGSGEWALKNRMNVSTGQPDGYNVRWFVHTWLQLVPPEQYADTHPEFYSEMGGKRLDPRGDRLVNLCTTNPAVAEAAAQTIDRLVTQDPSIDMISVDPEDTQEFCHCAACDTQYSDPALPYELRNSRRVFDFTNRVAELVAPKHPNLTLKTIAYHTYLRPPPDPNWRPRENVAIQFCRFMCHNHALADPSCPPNRGFDAAYREWLGRTNRLLFYEYYWKVSWVGLPWPVNRMLRADLPRFRDNHLPGIATQFSTNYATNGLGYWLAAKLLWNADADVHALLDTYYSGFFAEAAAPVKRYYEDLDHGAQASGVHLAEQSPYPEILALFTPALIEQLNGDLQEAAKVARTDDVRRRVEMLQSAVRYADLVRDYLTAVRDSVGSREVYPWSGMKPEGAEVATAAATERAQAIRHFLALPENAEALDQPNEYTEVLLNPKTLPRNLLEGKAGEVVLTRAQWLKDRGLPAKAVQLPPTFSIWVYGNDLDFIDGKPEHTISLKGPDGAWEEVGGVGNTEAIGDGHNACFVVSGIDSARYLRGDRIELRFENRPGGPYASHVFGFWLLPDETGLTPTEATRRLESDVNAIRAASFAFTEYGYSGFLSGEEAPVVVPIDLSR